MITLKSREGETFEVAKGLACQSSAIRHICSDIEDATIPINNISSIILRYLEARFMNERIALRNIKAQLVNADFETLKAFVVAVFSFILNGIKVTIIAALPMVGQSSTEFRRIPCDGANLSEDANGGSKFN
uniref:Uncharacterized protein LOC104240568 n=1 Tax=Nicotiana sylvestris TaxID=4096 RepID=A0A1U7Y3A6_NICSY|nr:PREDICTED: uncharacterized protein LOC104240568 [Nicotiana sylvestris]